MKRFSKQQMEQLAPYVRHFTTAVKSGYSMYPGTAALTKIHRIYSEATGYTGKLNLSCGKCVVSLLTDCGNMYFDTLEHTKVVAVAAAPEKKRTRKTIKTKKDGNTENQTHED